MRAGAAFAQSVSFHFDWGGLSFEEGLQGPGSEVRMTEWSETETGRLLNQHQWKGRARLFQKVRSMTL